ncbi:transcription factor TCP12-like [Iris pallida]|uniref:Transcription factor TCP12-like n=1 Tax=Iris pallida TaxID=29817 RepID=A0AAX6DUM1_IRIPA|nr:transcription factor TCP12-like [Iris pallida]
MLPYANPPPFLFDATSACFANEVATLSPLAFVDAYNNLPFFSFETPLPPPDPAPAEGGGRRKRQRGQRNDRHSKIRTTRGLRDRRMRLSIDIAGRFFALQDMLGLEKASATIEWLLEQSKPAIDRAAVQAGVRSSSGPGGASDRALYEKAKELQPPSPRPSAVHTATSRRESRADARARARSRTIEKKKMLLEAEDGGIGIDSTEQLLGQYSTEKVLSPVGSLSQGRKLVDDINTKEYDFECLPIAVDGESSPLRMFGYHQSKDYSLIFNDTDASCELLHITGNFSVEPEDQNLLHKKAEVYNSKPCPSKST